MPKRRLGGASPDVSRLVLRDFELFDDRSGVQVTVHSQELESCFEQLAEANGWQLSDILGNHSVSSTVQPLGCRVVTHLPPGGGFSFEESGYIALKLKQSCTMRGHTFMGSTGNVEARDGDFRPRLSRSSRSPPQPTDHPPSPPRKRRCVGSPSWLEGHDLTPGSPSSELAGQTQPLPIRLHRAAALALSTDPEVDSKLLVRHICGNKRCAIAAHYRFGTEADNKADEAHHRRHPGCSREVYQPRQ